MERCSACMRPFDEVRTCRTCGQPFIFGPEDARHLAARGPHNPLSHCLRVGPSGDVNARAGRRESRRDKPTSLMAGALQRPRSGGRRPPRRASANVRSSTRAPMWPAVDRSIRAPRARHGSI